MSGFVDIENFFLASEEEVFDEVGHYTRPTMTRPTCHGKFRFVSHEMAGETKQYWATAQQLKLLGIRSKAKLASLRLVPDELLTAAVWLVTSPFDGDVDSYNYDLVLMRERIAIARRVSHMMANFGIDQRLRHWVYSVAENRSISLDMIIAVSRLIENEVVSLDSEGHYGLNEFMAQRLWYRAGVGTTEARQEYFWRAIRFLDAGNHWPSGTKLFDDFVALMPRYKISLTQMRVLARIAKIPHGHRVSGRTRDRIINIRCPWRRMLILADVREKLQARSSEPGWFDTIGDDARNTGGNYRSQLPKLPYRSVDWSLLNLQDRRAISHRLMDRATQWYWLMGRLGLDRTLEWVPSGELRGLGCSPFDVPKATLEEVAMLVQMGSNTHIDYHKIRGVLTLGLLFGKDANAQQKFRSMLAKASLDVGSLFADVEVAVSLSAEERQTVRRLISTDVRFATGWKRIKYVSIILGRVPRSFEELDKFMMPYEGIVNMEVATAAADAKLDQEEFEEVQEEYLKFLKRKKRVEGQMESLPLGVKEEFDGYTIKFLERGDPRGLFLGELTNCCQSVGSAGGSCAIAGTNDHDKGFVVIESGDKIIAQSWVWLADTPKKALILDSIEAKGLSEAQLDKVAHLVDRWSTKICAHYMVSSVHIGDTGYGITEKVAKRLVSDKSTSSEMRPSKYSGYLDGKRQFQIAGATSV